VIDKFVQSFINGLIDKLIIGVPE